MEVSMQLIRVQIWPSVSLNYSFYFETPLVGSWTQGLLSREGESL